ncbi:MAG TPA: DNA repair protein RadC [Polyangiaceae bacterium]|jgi:DNA repair protein RadC
MVDLRERSLAYGTDALSDAELVALLLGTGARGQSVLHVAATLLENGGGLPALSRVGPHGLYQRGVGPAKATRLSAAFELGRRAMLGSLGEKRQVFSCFEEVAAWAHPRLSALDHEEVWLLSLDAKYGLKSARCVAQGGAHGCALSVRDILGPALRDAASSIVLIHNHPSGDPEPSPEDMSMTRAVQAGGQAVGVPLVDHVIVARQGACSLYERGLHG